MKRSTEIFGLCLVFALTGLAEASPAKPSAQPMPVAYSGPVAAAAQDRDDRDHHDDHDRDHDRDKRWDADRDRAWHRDPRHTTGWDAARDREWHHGPTRGNGYRSVLAPEWQQKYNSYYQRWLSYRATNNQAQMRSMEGRMQSIMRNYNIPPNTPYGEIAQGR
jgi:hypothetical protein